MSRSKSSERWLAEHFADKYVKQSHQLAVRSRAAFKLIEIDKRDRLLKPGLRVIELGAAPGGWTQYISEKVGPTGDVLAVDILEMEAVEGVTVMCADFTADEALEAIRSHFSDQKVDLVLSDMAPNFTGQPVVDQPRSMYLAELALDMCEEFLAPHGRVLVKTFQGAGFEELMHNFRQQFKVVKTRKPDASRARSREVYILAGR